MSGLLAGKVWQSNLGAHLKPLAAAMADIANDDGTSIFPSVAYLSWLLGKKDRSIQYGLDELKKLGVIAPVAFDTGGRGHPTEYKLSEDRLPKRTPWKEVRKGATSAPPPGQRVQRATVKGATSDSQRVQSATQRVQRVAERVQRVAPDPSGSVTDPPTDTSLEPTRGNRAERGSRLPDDFCLSSEMTEWAAKEAPSVDLDKALSEFKDYWRGVPGQRGRKLDWPATFRNRLRDIANRAPRFQRNGSNQPNTASHRSSSSDYEFKPKAVIR